MARPSLLRRWAAKREVRRIADSELFVVLYWPTTDHHVPELKGPYYSRDHGLAVRNQVRSVQRREKMMAQLMPLSRYPMGEPKS